MGLQGEYESWVRVNPKPSGSWPMGLSSGPRPVISLVYSPGAAGPMGGCMAFAPIREPCALASSVLPAHSDDGVGAHEPWLGRRREYPRSSVG